MSEEMRKEFEEWCVDNDLSYQMSFGQYHNTTTSNYWRIWKASREAMKPIKLPVSPKLNHVDAYDYYADGVHDTMIAIKQAGYKVEE